ncbi:MAG: DNA repair protein RecN [Acidimicrobiia bacterium]
MLVELRVENLGIIEEILIPLGGGMTAITGETGAGKTLLVDALELLCGGRADPGAVREGADEARVEGRFVTDADPDVEVVLARVVPVVGRSRGYINGRLATATELTEAGRLLVDLHGQHSHQSLLAPAEQRALLDRAAGGPAAEAQEQLTAARTQRRRLTEELADLGGDDRARAREIDLLRYQLTEIDDAHVDGPEEDARLGNDESILADAEAHRDALAVAYESLEGPAEDAIGAALGALSGRDPFAGIASRLQALQAETAEAARETRVALESVVVDPEQLATVQARRARLHDLTRKYGPTLTDVIAYADETRSRVADLESHDVRAGALQAELAEIGIAEQRAAAALTKARRAVAGPLATAVTDQLRQLALPKAQFTVDIRPAELTDDGADEVTFLLAPNAGEPARPLAKAASGGELSRAMLALRVVLSEAPPTLVFDEVDAGIGGEAGSAVGRALAGLGGHHQVFCVTHLPQVAAFADSHVAVAKGETRGRTRAGTTLLLDDARVAELARMLAGDLDSTHARAHANELLERAAADRGRVRAR